MANQTVPITLNWGPISVDMSALNINQLGQIIAAQLAGSIRADVSFYLEVLADPTNFITNLVFNSTQRIWKAWDQGAGAYVPLTQFQLGDVKQTFVATDQVAVGWVILNGRDLDAIPGITSAQRAVLDTFFPSGTLPDLTPANVNNLPASDSFSGIAQANVLPANDVIGALPIGATYDQTEVEALRDDTEILRDSVADVQTQLATNQSKSSDLLTALRTPTSPPLYSAIFCGYS